MACPANPRHHAKVRAMTFPLSLEPGSPLRSHASPRTLREPHGTVTNRYQLVTNAGTTSRPTRSVERDAVAGLSHGHNVAGVSWIVFQLSSQFGDMCVDRAAHDFGIVAPYVAQQVEAGNDIPAPSE